MLAKLILKTTCVTGIALGSALLGAIYPGMIAVRQDPIEALAYE